VVVIKYVAAIGTARDVVEGDFCDVSVIESEDTNTKITDDGAEVPVFELTDRVAMPAQELTIRTDDADRDLKIQPEAERVLSANGWRVVGKWEPSDNACYAGVELS
jgi:hypothetical protein